MINKPLSVIRDEMLNGICDAINEAARYGLPHCAIADILDNLSHGARANANAELKRDRERYLAALKATEHSEPNDNRED